LHPTPAVCGTPLNEAREAISKIENFERGLYAGVIGWFDAKGDGELVVGIRSALIDGCKARLYTGSGIVKGSDPNSERRETDIKLQAMLQNLR
jgi:menaquinone-specific isochorismate synthase